MRWRTAIAGMGQRGRDHAHGFLKWKDRFDIVGIYNRTPGKAKQAAAELGITGGTVCEAYEMMLKETKPEILAICLMPSMRLEIVKLAADYGVKGIMLEKPMALSLEEAREIVRICDQHGIKAAVCHQHKYLRSFRHLYETIADNELGEITEMKASCRPWSSQLGTHFIDYIMWANHYEAPLSVVGHVHGRTCLSDSHPSPDYMMGQIAFANHVRGTIECGYFSKTGGQYEQAGMKGPNIAQFWTDDRLTIYGNMGYAYAETNGLFVKCSAARGMESIDYKDFFEHEQYLAQELYTEEFADWMEGKVSENQCDIHHALAGYEVLEAIYVSALDLTRADIPMDLKGRNLLREMQGRLRNIEFRQT